MVREHQGNIRFDLNRSSRATKLLTLLWLTLSTTLWPTAKQVAHALFPPKNTAEKTYPTLVCGVCTLIHSDGYKRQVPQANYQQLFDVSVYPAAKARAFLSRRMGLQSESQPVNVILGKSIRELLAPYIFTGEANVTLKFNASKIEPILTNWWKTWGMGEPNVAYTHWRQEQSCTHPMLFKSLKNDTLARFAKKHHGQQYYIPMPPPNITGLLHLGHALFLAIQDALIRFHRMLGFRTLWVPGTDHAGIAGYMAFQKESKQEHDNVLQIASKMEPLSIQDWEMAQKQRIYSQMQKFGASAAWSRRKFTLDADVSYAVTRAFIELYERSLIYKGKYIVNWSVKMETALSDEEVEFREESVKLYYLKYLLETNETGLLHDGLVAGDEDQVHSHRLFIPVATTRPETMFGDVAICVHPQDLRYKHFIGRYVRIPFTNKRIVVVGDSLVNQTFGTGAMKLTPGNDVTDFRLAEKKNLLGSMPLAFDKKGKMTSNSGPMYVGMDRLDCRKKLWCDLETHQLAIKTVNYTTRVPRYGKTGELVEPLISHEWFLNTDEMAENARRCVSSNQIKIIPKRFEKSWNLWLQDLNHWCLSRQLPYGHRLPVWYVRHKTMGNAADNKSAFQPYNFVLVAYNETDAKQKAIEKLLQQPETAMYAANGTFPYAHFSLEQDPDVLDTWFSSSLWPLTALGWPKTEVSINASNTLPLGPLLPAACLETGYDILLCWVTRMVMLSTQLTGIIPFKTVFLHGLVKDLNGQKMSKSKGNTIDPVTVVDKFGADALRFALLASAVAGADVRLSDEKIDKKYRFVNKLWNIGRFVSKHYSIIYRDKDCLHCLRKREYLSIKDMQHATLAQRYIVSCLHSLCERVTLALKAYDFSAASKHLEDFIWKDFASWYLGECSAIVNRINCSSIPMLHVSNSYPTESQKFRSDSLSAVLATKVLRYAWETLLKLLHPFAPYVTETLFHLLPTSRNITSIMVSQWPFYDDQAFFKSLYYDKLAIESFPTVQAIISEIRSFRAENKIHPSKQFATTIMCKSSSMLKELKASAATIGLYARIDPKQIIFVEWRESNFSSNAIPLAVRDDVLVILNLDFNFDASTEKQRLLQRLQKLEAQLVKLQEKSAHKNFEEKTPKAILKERNDRIRVLQSEMSAVRDITKLLNG